MKFDKNRGKAHFKIGPVHGHVDTVGQRPPAQVFVRVHSVYALQQVLVYGGKPTRGNDRNDKILIA